tara:strand:- start:1911 stop:2870 length:960 start_codon:yes stop_codon:yes gene_type:complete
MKVFIAGHNGMVGSSILRKLSKNKKIKILVKSRKELDLLDEKKVEDFFKKEHIDQVYYAAARVGGIHANDKYPADFIIENLKIQNNILIFAQKYGVDRLLFLGSSCIYPKLAKQPIQETELLSGYLESTNEPYAIAKIAGIKMCESINRQYQTDFRSVMPTNLYGPKDNFHPKNSHVLPALLDRFHRAKMKKSKSMHVWGSGNALREFMHVDDLAAACIHVMQIEKDLFWKNLNPRLSHINIGTGEDHTIRELADLIKNIVNYEGDVLFDTTKPDGTPRKLLDNGLIKRLGWKHKISLEEGIKSTYEWYKENFDSLRKA